MRAIYSNGCVSLSSDTIWGTCYNRLVENRMKNNITVVPNPAEDFIEINSNLILQKIDLINFNGSIIKSIQGNRSKNIRISLGGVSPGLYFISMETETGVAVKKLVIMHE